MKPSFSSFPFGSPMPNRSFSASSYKYGFNGKENDNETVATGQGTQDYGMRIYNPALGRFLSIDPLFNEYPDLTTYQFAGNSPILAIDVDGMEPGTVRRSFRPRLSLPEAKDILKRANPKPVGSNPFGLRGTNQKNVNKIKFIPSTVEPFNEREPAEKSKTGEILNQISELVDQIKEYQTKTETIMLTSPGFSDNTDSYFSAQYLTVTTAFIEIPAAVQKLEEKYQAKVKSYAQGNLSDAEFAKLPIQKQADKYSAAKAVNGTSPLELFKEQAVAKIKKDMENPPPAPNNLGGTTKETLTATPTY